jgi:septal ring factor EnvC (AmiA/AmiB activator)
MIRILLFALSFMLLLTPSPVMANPSDKLTQTKEELQAAKKRADQLAAEEQRAAEKLDRLNNKLSVIGKKIRENQQSVININDRLAELRDDQNRLLADINQNRDQSGHLLLAMQRLSRQPVEALVLKPGAPITAARTGMMLSATLPALRGQITRLQQDLKKLEGVTDQLADQKRMRAKRQADLDRQQTNLVKLIRQRKLVLNAKRAEKTSAQQQADELAKQVQDLSQLMAALAAQKTAGRHKPVERGLTTSIFDQLPLGGKPGIRSGNQMALPVAGRITTDYNETDDFGLHTKGMTITARSGALVTSPAGGRIRFSGPFRRFDNILIIDHGRGYHSVIAGLYELYAGVGDRVRADQPLGRMPDTDAPPLYFELRHNGRPTDPKEFLS